MATAITSTPDIAVITLSATAMVATQVTGPLDCTHFMVVARASALYVAFSGTDGSAIGANRICVPAGTRAVIPVRRDNDVATPIIYVASPDVSAVARVMTLSDASMNNVAGAPHEEFKIVHKWGYNAACAATEETVWSGSTVYGTTPGYASGDDITKIKSDNAADTMVATIEGLDQNGLEVVQTATLTGVTPVTLTTALNRVYRVALASTNTGTIEVTDTAGTTTYARVEPTIGQTQMAIYTIPTTLATGETVAYGEVTQIEWRERGNVAATCRLLANGIEKDAWLLPANGSPPPRYYASDGIVGSGLRFDPGTDLEGVATGNLSKVVCAFSVRLVVK